MFLNAKARARKRGVPFTLTLTDLVIPDRCPVFDEPLAPTAGCQGGGPWSPSLDRIVPEKGYVPGNVQVVSLKFNTIKSNATPEEIGMAAVYALRQQKES